MQKKIYIYTKTLQEYTEMSLCAQEPSGRCPSFHLIQHENTFDSRLVPCENAHNCLPIGRDFHSMRADSSTRKSSKVTKLRWWL